MLDVLKSSTPDYYLVPTLSGRIFGGPFSQPGQKLGFQESDVGVGDTVPPAVNPLAVRVASRCQALVISKETNHNKQGVGLDGTGTRDVSVSRSRRTKIL